MIEDRPPPWEELERRGPDFVEVDGVAVRAGSVVRLGAAPDGQRHLRGGARRALGDRAGGARGLRGTHPARGHCQRRPGPGSRRDPSPRAPLLLRPRGGAAARPTRGARRAAAAARARGGDRQRVPRRRRLGGGARRAPVRARAGPRRRRRGLRHPRDGPRLRDAGRLRRGRAPRRDAPRGRRPGRCT